MEGSGEISLPGAWRPRTVVEKYSYGNLHIDYGHQPTLQIYRFSMQIRLLLLINLFLFICVVVVVVVVVECFCL